MITSFLSGLAFTLGVSVGAVIGVQVIAWAKKRSPSQELSQQEANVKSIDALIERNNLSDQTNMRLAEIRDILWETRSTQ